MLSAFLLVTGWLRLSTPVLHPSFTYNRLTFFTWASLFLTVTITGGEP